MVGAGFEDSGIPLLDLVEALEERDRNEDGNSFLAVADLDLESVVR